MGMGSCGGVGSIAICRYILIPTSFFYLLGHLSFIINFLAYAQKDLIKLRLIAISSISVGLLYNGYIHINMPEGQNLWLVLFWLSVFLIQNCFNVIMAIRNSMEVSLTTSQKSLMVQAFPMMYSRDWLTLLNMAQRKTFLASNTIIEQGATTHDLMLLTQGKVLEKRQDSGIHTVRGVGSIWGEITYIVGEDEINESPCDVVVQSEQAEVLYWSYKQLEELESKNPRIKAALLDGFVRSAGLKQGLLRAANQSIDMHENADRRSCGIPTQNGISKAIRVLSRCSFLELTSYDLSVLQRLGVLVEVASGQEYQPSSLSFIIDGRLRVQCNDLLSISLGQGSCVGEIGWLERMGWNINASGYESVTLTAESSTTLWVLNDSATLVISMEHPATFARLCQAVCFSMAQKLMRPLHI